MLILLLTACASTTVSTGTSVPSIAQPNVTTVIEPTTAPTIAIASTTTAAGAPTTGTTPAAELVVTEMMANLGITGERYATQGDPNAPITVVEFSDYGCPFCGRYVSSTYPRIKADFIDTGKIFYVYKDFPIVQLHPQAALAAEAAECSGDQGKYWEMHELLFANQQQWDTTPQAARRAFQNFADELALDAAQLNSCLDQQTYRDGIQADVSQGRRLGTTGTPTFVINGKQLVGSQPYTAFANAINNELAAESPSD